MNKYILDPELLETSPSCTVISYNNFLKKYNEYPTYDNIEYDISRFLNNKKLIIKYRKLNGRIIKLFQVTSATKYIIIYNNYVDDLANAYFNNIHRFLNFKYIIERIGKNNMIEDNKNLKYHRYVTNKNIYEYISENDNSNAISDIIYEDTIIKINLLNFFRPIHE